MQAGVTIRDAISPSHHITSRHHSSSLTGESFIELNTNPFLCARTALLVQTIRCGAIHVTIARHTCQSVSPEQPVGTWQRSGRSNVLVIASGCATIKLFSGRSSAQTGHAFIACVSTTSGVLIHRSYTSICRWYSFESAERTTGKNFFSVCRHR